MVTNYSENAIDSRITLLNVRHYTEIRKSNIASTEPLNDFEVERTAVSATVKFTFARSHLAALKNCKNWFPTSVRSDRSIVLVATLSSENLRRSAKKPRNRIIQWQRPREKSTRVSIKFANAQSRDTFAIRIKFSSLSLTRLAASLSSFTSIYYFQFYGEAAE